MAQLQRLLMHQAVAQLRRQRLLCGPTQVALFYTYKDERLGRREIVGHGFNGEPTYVDRPDFPCPAIRWEEFSQALEPVYEKEFDDWRKLTIDEKKRLYRASFRQTFAEARAPNAEWKSNVAAILLCLSLGVWMVAFFREYVYEPLPPTLTREWQEAALKRMIDMEVNPIEGLASKWDYDKKQWKE